MVRATEWEKDPEPVPVGWDGLIRRMRWDGYGRTCLDDARAAGDVEVSGDEGDVCE